MNLNACDMCRICKTTSKFKSVHTLELNWIGFSILISKLAGLYELDSFFILTQPLSFCVRSSLSVSLISPTSCHKILRLHVYNYGGPPQPRQYLLPFGPIFFFFSFGQVVFLYIILFWASCRF